MQSTLIEQRAIILAVEALATDFVGWGQLFPIARSRAEAMFARDAGDWPKLIELYLPRERRTDAEFIRMFTPSGSMSAGTTVTHPILEHPMGLFGKLFSKRADPELERARQHLEQLIQDSKKPMGADEEAVLAYREALKEYTRERVPLDWAMTQNNLGNALFSLGKRDSGTGARRSRNIPVSACRSTGPRRRSRLRTGLGQNVPAFKENAGRF
jgi:hypothetical protein